jgi:peptidoglycan-associated lipoprotein
MKKFENPFRLLCSVLLIVGLASCSSTSPKSSQDGPGGPWEDAEAVDQAPIPEGGVSETTKLPPPEPPRPSGGIEGIEYGKWSAVHFDFDSSAIQSEDYATLDAISNWMKENGSSKIMIAGHCDERGTLEYNLGLGQRRGASAREYLVKQGIPAGRISSISYGEEQPVDPGHNEEAWRQNRRAEFGVIP